MRILCGRRASRACARGPWETWEILIEFESTGEVIDIIDCYDSEEVAEGYDEKGNKYLATRQRHASITVRDNTTKPTSIHKIVSP